MSTTGLPVISFQHWRWSPCCLNISHLALCRESWTRLLWTRGFTRWVPPCLRHHVREACSSQNQPKQLQILRHHVSTWKSAGDEKAGGSRDATHHLHRVSPRCPGSFFSVKHVFVLVVSSILYRWLYITSTGGSSNGKSWDESWTLWVQVSSVNWSTLDLISETYLSRLYPGTVWTLASWTVLPLQHIDSDTAWFRAYSG